MQNIVTKYITDFMRSKAKRRRLQLVVSTLSLAVVAMVFWQLRIVGISMTDEALCGYTEHTHTAECLTMKLVCGLEESKGHAHTDACHTTERILVCKKEAHSHSDDCLKTRVQLCGLAEHSHGNDCFTTEKTLICSKEFDEHKHGDSCYKTENVLTCSKTTDEHKHGDGCYATKDVLVCENTSEGHEHGSDCYKAEKVLTCDKTTDEHKHGDGCYSAETKLVCDKTTDEHKHSDSCYSTETKLVCEKAVHTHTEEACFDLVSCNCAKEEHTHSDSCFQDRDKLICGQEEHAAHSHTAECEREAYGCGFEKEHTHTLLCYSDAKADLETASDWESTLPALSGTPAKDLVAVASSQVGYAESQANYKVDEDETTKHGYTRYGEWYGNPYGNWDTMFVSFCLKYSNHPDYDTLKNSGAEAMRQAAISAGKYTAVAPDLLPAAGSVVFLDKNSNGSADSAAIVTYAGNGVIAVIMGDLDGAVGEAQYAMNNGTIMGYALLPPREEQLSFAAGPKSDDLTAETGEKTGDEPESQADGITVTFVINNSAYTSDNGYTHVKIHGAEDPTTRGFISEPGGITYEKWDGQDVYRVRGTGTLMRYTIPAGTSLSGNGYSLPNIAYNGEGGSVAYRSAFNWVTDAGMICKDNTVFTTDTVLYLYMYETDTWCTLNYVCNCSSGGSHGIVYFVSGFGEPLFSWGQSIDAAYIPTAEAVNSQYTGSQWCTAGPDYGMTFKEWYVIDSTTNTEVPFTAGMPLLESYQDPNATRTIKVYARWEDAPVSVTATFVNGTESSTVTLNKGDALGTNLPAAPDAPENKIFVGWQIGDTGEYATEETQITASTTYTAVFADKVTATFKNGEETVEIRDLAVNSPLGALPTATGTMGQTLLGWVLEGSTDYLTSETVITQSNTYVPVFAETATITFMNGATQFGSTVADVPIGAKLWIYLPEEVPEGYIDDEGIEWIFEGWQINGQDQLVDDTTVVPAGLENNALVLNAVFSEFAGWNVYFHDIDPDSNEILDENVESIDWLLPDGETVADWYGEDALNSDGALVKDCLWYYKDGNGQKQEYDLSTPVTSEMHLYTYSYRLVLMKQAPAQTSSLLNLFPVASAAQIDISEDGNTITLTLREGEKPKASDFIVNGEDYTLYKWVDQSTNQTLDLTEILETGVTENITAVADGKLLTASATKSMWLYVFINEERYLVSNESVPCYQFNGGGRYYISAAKLEEIFGDFGFTADMLKPGTKYFPHADAGRTDGKIWADAAVVEQTIEGNTLYFSPVVADDKNVDVYYTPYQTVPSSGGHPYTDFTKTDTFYTFEVNDPAGIYYDPGELDVLDYVLTGYSYTITLPYDPLAPWHASKRILATGEMVEMDPEQDNFTVDIDEDNGTATYTFHSVTCPIVMQPYREGEVQIIYNTNVTGTVFGSTPTVNGLAEYSDTVQMLAGSVYAVKSPSKLQYSYESTSALRTYMFEGWMVNGSQTDLLQPGEELTRDYFVNNGNTLELTAKWRLLPLSETVSFYVNMQMVQAGQTDTSTDNGNYTGALYSTEVTFDPSYTASSSITAYGDDLTRTGEIDAALRTMTSTPLSVNLTGNGSHTATLASFPNDEQLLASIRTKQAEYIANFQNNSTYYDPNDPTNVTEYRKVGHTNAYGQFVYTYQIICEPKYTDDGQVELHYIPVDELTPEHFTIHWYVLKYEGTNGWHIDGVLVKKQAYITVNKVFHGEQEVIDSITDDFNITVTNAATGEAVYTLVTREPAENEAVTKYDYLSSDERTYTWVLPVNASTKYTLRENNYEYDGDLATVAEVQLDNPVTGSDEIIGRQPYSSAGVTVKAKSYNANVGYTGYQTVSFYNSYLPIEALPISKLDDSGKPVPGVAFKLMQDGNPLDILMDPAGTYYVSRDGGNNDHIPADAEPVTSGRITVNELGYALVMGLYGSGNNNYTLVEDYTPKGYTPAPEINFTMDAETGITLNGQYGNDVTTPNGTALRIVNNSAKMNVKVTKQWLDGTDTEVKVKLTLDGTPLNYAELTLNAGNNWTTTWENIPAYVGGSLAQYSIRETWIGETAFTSTIPGGFQNYIVSVSAPAYTYNDDNLPTEAAFTVTNSVRTGSLQFTKVDGDGNGLPGAGFQLFKDVSCSEESAYDFGVISNLYGIVSFGDLPVGTYYMKELRTPAGYKENETVYLISVTADGVTIADKYTLNEADGSIVSIDSVITNNTIVNLPETADLKVRKVRRVVSGEDVTFAPLEGAKFEVYLLNGSSRVKISREIDGKTYNTFTSDSDGYLTVPDLLLGNYELVETHAPVGFYRRTEPISFNVAYGVISADDDSANNGWHIEEVADPDTGDVSVCITVENDPGSELPHTGGIGTHYGTMAGLLMMAASLYAILLRRKREGRAV